MAKSQQNEKQLARTEGPGKVLANYAAFQEQSEAAAALAANVGSLSEISLADFTHVPTPSGGSLQWTYESVTGEVSQDAIEGLLVYQCEHGSLWPTDEPTEGNPPLLITHDLRIAKKVGDDYGTLDPQAIEAARREDGYYDWQALPYTQMGSGKNGIGKRAKEGRMFCILPQGETLPMLVRIQPGSITDIRRWLLRLPVPYFQVEVSLTLTKAKSKGGITYSKVVPRVTSVLSAEQGALVAERYTKPIAAAIRTSFEEASSFATGSDDIDL